MKSTKSKKEPHQTKRPISWYLFSRTLIVRACGWNGIDLKFQQKHLYDTFSVSVQSRCFYLFLFFLILLSLSLKHYTHAHRSHVRVLLNIVSHAVPKWDENGANDTRLRSNDNITRNRNCSTLTAPPSSQYMRFPFIVPVQIVLSRSIPLWLYNSDRFFLHMFSEHWCARWHTVGAVGAHTNYTPFGKGNIIIESVWCASHSATGIVNDTHVTNAMTWKQTRTSIKVDFLYL